MKKIIFNGPINSLSLGNVSYNFLRQLFYKQVPTIIFPTNNQASFDAFDKIDTDFLEWIKSCAQDRLKAYCSSTPSLRNWHINGSEQKVSNDQYLYTFYEVDSPTESELNIIRNQKHVFFSSKEAADIFSANGCDNVSHVPLGFDEDFYKTEKKYLGDDVIHFGLIGKFERRKNTQGIIQLWLQKYGNNPKYQLSLLINNPFFPENDFKTLMNQTLFGKRWSNVNILPHLKTNSEVNDLMNSIDVDLSGLSNGEGWNLPSFNATALGKWSIVTNCSSHKDWANKDNCILVEPKGKQECYDNFFFKKGSMFNQGSYYLLDTNLIIDAFEKSEKVAKSQNINGEKLREEFTYSKTIDSILNKIQ